MTLRQYFYRLIGGLLKPDEYNSLKYAKKNGIEDEILHPKMFLDRSRPSYGTNTWDSLEDFLKILPNAFKLNYWKDEEYKVEIWTEKDALSQVLLSEAETYRVPVRATRGYNSDTMDYEWGGEDKIILYFGDFDPSGLDMDKKLAKVKVHAVYRVAMTEKQKQGLQSVGIKDSEYAEQHGNKKGDPRAEAYKKLFGDRCWELDVMEPSALRQLVRDSIERFITFDLEQKQAEEQAIRDKLKRLGQS
jgi:hypothetical protein